MSVPANPKIYHIVHVDRLPSIVADGGLYCDATMAGRGETGTTVGIGHIKERRLKELTLDSHPGLHVGDCVPFYFCPRSIMLYLLHRGNHENVTYGGGQGPIVHLEADLHRTIAWAEANRQRWAFTLSNAGSTYFEDRCRIDQLDQVDWDAVGEHYWQGCKEAKQAEFLLESRFPWELVERIGVHSQPYYQQVLGAITRNSGRPLVEIQRNWYY